MTYLQLVVKALERAIVRETFISYENRYKWFDVKIEGDAVFIEYESQEGLNTSLLDELQITVDYALAQLKDEIHCDIFATVWCREDRSAKITKVMVDSTRYVPTTFAVEYDDLFLVIVKDHKKIKYCFIDQEKDFDPWKFVPPSFKKWVEILTDALLSDPITSFEEIDDDLSEILPPREIRRIKKLIEDSWEFIKSPAFEE